jgi:hypothetical protein
VVKSTLRRRRCSWCFSFRTIFGYVKYICRVMKEMVIRVGGVSFIFRRFRDEAIQRFRNGDTVFSKISETR